MQSIGAMPVRVRVGLMWIPLLTCWLFASGLAAQTPPLLTGTVQTTAGLFHTCALGATGGVKCWGSNRLGQLGARDQAPNQRETPVDVFGLSSGVRAISAGHSHTCALLQSGSVKCWGDNARGQLGDGTIQGRPLPTEVVDLGGPAIAISSGEAHTCAVLASGRARCWGGNGFGQLGDGSLDDRLRPVDAVGLSSGVTQISAAHEHTCAVRAGGALCWGRNDLGQLGTGRFGGELVPTTVAGLTSGVSEVHGGRGHSCAVVNAAARCWGDNAQGQLGNGTFAQSRVPIVVVELTSGVSRIAVNFEHSCALLASGGVKCWGDNFYGQLGDGSALDRNRPTQVFEFESGATSLSAGYLHGCATTATSTVRCWGNNFDGQLGNGSFSNRLLPRRVLGLDASISKISAGFQHSCAWSASVGSRCWGDNASGQLGNGSRTGSEVAVVVSNLSDGSGVIAGGVFHTCSLTVGGGVKCWGQNSMGQVGDASFQDRLAPVAVTGLASGVVSIAAGGFHACAVLANGSARCWGSNGSGQLGVGVTGDLGQPTDLLGLNEPLAEIAAGEAHTCALTRAGAVFCWGNNASGQLGDGSLQSRPLPVAVSGLGSGVRAISLAGNFSCALLNSGGVRCWGANESGQLGEGSNVSRRVPTPVNGLDSGVLAIEAGWFHACAVSNDGGLRCWGRNTEGQLGNNSTIARSVPGLVAGYNVDTAAYVGGGGQSCVLRQGVVSCWGANNFGQVGDGSSWGIRQPVVVVQDNERRAVIAAAPNANAASQSAALDTQGRYLVFESRASNLVPGDTNSTTDIFRRDIHTGSIIRVSLDNAGAQMNGESREPNVSGDGQLIVFVAPDASVNGLLGEDAKASAQRRKNTGNGLFLRNALAGATQRIGGAQPTGTPTTPRIAGNGEAIVWTQPVVNASEGQVGQENIYRSQLQLQPNGSVVASPPVCLTCRLLAANGTPTSTAANGPSRNPAISSDGRWLAWETTATNVPTGTLSKTSPCPGASIILLRNMLTGATLTASAPAMGGSCGSNGQSAARPSINADGSRVAFESTQPLIALDRNGFSDIYSFEANTRNLVRVSVGPLGDEANAPSSSPSVAQIGTVTAFVSSATNLDPSFADNNGVPDVHVAGSVAGSVRLSQSDSGGEADRPGEAPVLSGNGGQVALQTAASQFAAGLAGSQQSVFVRPNPLAGATSTSADRSGVWWRASESGWGLVTADQGSVLILGWFTYDTDGEPMWSSGALLPQADGTYRGQMLRTSGTPLAQIVGIAAEASTPQADVSLRFLANAQVQFEYRLVNGTSQTKQLERFPFSSRTTICRPAQGNERAMATNYSDIWWGGALTSGWGLFLTQIDTRMFPVWFTYDVDREPIFYTGIGEQQADGAFVGSLLRSRNGTPLLAINGTPASSGTDPVGSFRIAPSSGAQSSFNYQINGVSQSKPIERFVGGTAPPVCQTFGQ